jgi:hypothetical protein
MRFTQRFLMTAVLAMAATAAYAADGGLQMADLAPAQTSALVEIENPAGLRQQLLESPFWQALQKTEAARQWKASEKYAEGQRRLEELLERLDMSKEEALRRYLGGKAALVLLPSDNPKKPYGVFLTEATNADAERFVKAVGGQEVGRHRDVTIWEVQKEQRVDRMAFAGGVLMLAQPRADELHQVLDVAVGGGASLGTEGHFAKAVDGLPGGWRVRAYAAKIPPRQSPGAVALYPEGNDRVHAEWRIVSGAGDVGPNRPVALDGPACLPDSAVAAVTSCFHPEAIWEKVQQKLAERADGEERIRHAKMFVRGWFPGHPMDGIVAGFGPEAAGAIVKGEDGGAPGLVGMTRITASGRPVAHAFKDGLAAKAMILGALGQKGEKPVIINVREEEYGNASMLIIEAPDALTKILGDWAKDVALTVAVGEEWLIVGTTPAGVKRTIDTAAGKGKSLADAMKAAGERVPEEPVTRWGVVRPAEGAEIVLSWAEKLLGRERVEEAKRLTNLAELMDLVKRFLWQRTDEPEMIHGTADLQAVE